MNNDLSKKAQDMTFSNSNNYITSFSSKMFPSEYFFTNPAFLQVLDIKTQLLPICTKIIKLISN